MRAVVLAAVLVGLVACGAPRIEGSGRRADPPGGWVEYCRNHPRDPACLA